MRTQTGVVLSPFSYQITIHACFFKEKVMKHGPGSMRQSGWSCSSIPSLKSRVLELTVTTVKEEVNDSPVDKNELLLLAGSTRTSAMIDPDDERHLIGESADGKPECSLCRATFSRKCHALRHVKTVHSKSVHKVMCYVCRSLHKNEEARDVHVRQIHNIYSGRWEQGQENYENA